MTRESSTLPDTLKLSSGEEQTFELPNSSATTTFAKTFANMLTGTEKVLLNGPMGIGKSFFIRQVLRTLGVTDLSIASPTFTLIHCYELPLPSSLPARPTAQLYYHLIHADLYRLIPETSEDSANLTGLEEIGLLSELGKPQLVFIEWGERFKEIKPYMDYVVTLCFSSASAPHHVEEEEEGEHACSLTLKRLR